jgi:hypothetical protein
MLNRSPEPAAQHAAFTAYCTRADINLVQRLKWNCIGFNQRTKHYIYRRDDGQVMILTEGGKRIGENAALCEVANVLRETLRNGCCEDAMLPRATK